MRGTDRMASGEQVEPSGDGRPGTGSPLTGRATAAVLGTVLAVTAVGFGLVLAALWAWPGAETHAVTVLAWTVTVVSVAVLLGVHAVLGRAGHAWQSIGFHRPTRRLLHLLWQVPALLVVLLVVQGSVVVLTGVEPTSGDAVEAVFGAVTPTTAVALAVGLCVLAPVWEEATFRGVLYGGLRRRFRVPAAAVLAGVAFAAAHGVPVLLPYMFTGGVLFALLYEFHRTLWAPVIAHAALNSIVTIPLLLSAT